MSLKIQQIIMTEDEIKTQIIVLTSEKLTLILSQILHSGMGWEILFGKNEKITEYNIKKQDEKRI